MKESFTARCSVEIDAAPDLVWQTITDPEKIRQWLFGTSAVCDWKKGSSITYSGEWQGKAYVDKGTILEIEPPRLLVMSYWSSFSGAADAPENYQMIRYQIEPAGGGVLLSVTQENHSSEEARSHSEQHWKQALALVKQLSKV